MSKKLKCPWCGINVSKSRNRRKGYDVKPLVSGIGENYMGSRMGIAYNCYKCEKPIIEYEFMAKDKFFGTWIEKGVIVKNRKAQNERLKLKGIVSLGG